MSATVTAPADVLALARATVERPGGLPRSTWPRVAALLARQALEAAVAEALAARVPGLEDCSRRTQFLCLRWYVDEEVAHRAYQLWSALSSACHHQAYELPPAAAELSRWVEEAGQLIAALTVEEAR